MADPADTASCASDDADYSHAGHSHADHAEPHSHADDDACGCSHDHSEQGTPLFSSTVWLAIAGIAFVAAFLVSLLADNPVLEAVAVVGSLASLAAGFVILAPEISESVQKRQVNINTLLVIAAAGACLLGEFVEAAAVVFFFCVGEALEQRARNNTQSQIAHLLDLAPELVHLIEPDGLVIDIRSEDALIGSTLLLKAGERIALDATVASGSAHFDQSPVTGESMPVLKQPGDMLYAGSLCLDGRIECTTVATIQDSSLARMVRLVEQAATNRSPYERFINRFARYYTPLVVVLAIAIALVPPAIGLLTPWSLGSFSTWLYRALSLLVIACPCALVIATPVAVVSGISRLATQGVLVKGGAFIELAAKAKVLAFDKTGTLTEGHPRLEQIEVMQAARQRWPIDAEQQVLAIAAALEKDSNHPLASAVLEAEASFRPSSQDGVSGAGSNSSGNSSDAGSNSDAGSGAGDSSPSVSDLTEVAGKGITAVVDGKLSAIGSPAYISHEAAIEAAVAEVIAGIEAKGATVLALAQEGQLLAVFSVRDTLRPESARLMHEVSQAGLATVMLTGDNQLTAEAIGKEAGVGQVYAQLMPEQKMGHIEALGDQYGTVAFVGDGINDALALSAADVGIAMGAAGSDIAIEVADVALMADSIAELGWLFKLARKVMQTVRVSVAFTLAVKFAVMVLAVLGFAQMWMAILADVGMLVIVLLYCMRLGISPTRK